MLRALPVGQALLEALGTVIDVVTSDDDVPGPHGSGRSFLMKQTAGLDAVAACRRLASWAEGRVNVLLESLYAQRVAAGVPEVGLRSLGQEVSCLLALTPWTGGMTVDRAVALVEAYPRTQKALEDGDIDSRKAQIVTGSMPEVVDGDPVLPLSGEGLPGAVSVPPAPSSPSLPCGGSRGTTGQGDPPSDIPPDGPFGGRVDTSREGPDTCAHPPDDPDTFGQPSLDLPAGVDPADRSTWVGYRPGAALVRAVVDRDRECQFPTCRQPAWRGQIDHIEPFDPRRPAAEQTRPENLLALCTGHHELKTSGGWTVRRDPLTGLTTWTGPLGLTRTTASETAVGAVGAVRQSEAGTDPEGPADTGGIGPDINPGDTAGIEPDVDPDDDPPPPF